MIALLALTAFAHNPHDPVPLLAIWPDYATTGQLLAGRTPAQNWRPYELVTTDDVTGRWSQAMEGLDPVGQLSDVALSPDVLLDGVAVVATSTGAWVSTDAGATWMAAGLEDQLLVAATATRILGGVRLLVAARGGLVFASDDGGATWAPTVVQVGDDPRMHAHGATVAVASDRILWWSDDGGDTWLSMPLQSDARSVAVAPDGATLVGVEVGALMFRDGALEPLPMSDDMEGAAFAPDWPADPTYAVSSATTVYVTEDGGSTYDAREIGVSPSDQAGGRHVNGLELVEGPAGADRLFINMFEGLRFSDDLGVSWGEADIRPPHLVTGLSLSPDFATDGIVYVGTYDGGAYVSDDGGDHFEVRNVGLIRPNVYDTLVVPGAPDEPLWIATLGYLATSDLAGSGYGLSTLYEPGVYPTQLTASAAFATDGYALSGTRGDGILRTLDGGATWEQVMPHISQTTSVAIAADDPAQALAGLRNGAVYGSVDGGATWTAYAEFATSDSPAFVAHGDGRFLVGTGEGAFEIDGSGVVTALAEVTGPVEQVAVAADGTRFVALRGGSLLRSDPGQPFVDLGLVEGWVPHEIAPSPAFADDDTVFASSGTHLFRSVDRGATWAAIDPDPVRYEESCQAVVPDDRPMSPSLPGASAQTAYLLEEGHSASLDFIGTGVTFWGATGGGTVEVELDGVVVDTIDTSGGDPTAGVALYEVSGLPYEHHLITVHAAAGEAYVDAFDVSRALPPATTTPTTPTTGGTTTPSTTPTTGTTTPTSGTTTDTPTTGTTGVSGDEAEAKGCGCQVPSAPTAGWMAGLLLLGLTRRR